MARLVAFTGEFDGNQDVYVVPAAGGEPRRLTSHPTAMLRLRGRPTANASSSALPGNLLALREALYRASRGRFSDRTAAPDGRARHVFGGRVPARLRPRWNRRNGAGDAYIAIKNYRGGKTSPIWIARLADSSVTPLPRENSNDFNPMWVGDKNLLPVRPHRRDHAVQQRCADASGEAAPHERRLRSEVRLGRSRRHRLRAIWLAAPFTISPLAREHAVPVRIAADLPQIRPHFEKVGDKQILHAALSPTGARALFEARGEILTVPAEKGDIRNLTRAPGVADRDPACPPTAKWIAIFPTSRASMRCISAINRPRRRAQNRPRLAAIVFFYELTWSPDGKKIAYTTNGLNIWYLDIDQAKP